MAFVCQMQIQFCSCHTADQSRSIDSSFFFSRRLSTGGNAKKRSGFYFGQLLDISVVNISECVNFPRTCFAESINQMNMRRAIDQSHSCAQCELHMPHTYAWLDLHESEGVEDISAAPAPGIDHQMHVWLHLATITQHFVQSFSPRIEIKVLICNGIMHCPDEWVDCSIERWMKWSPN